MVPHILNHKNMFSGDSQGMVMLYLPRHKRFIWTMIKLPRNNSNKNNVLAVASWAWDLITMKTWIIALSNLTITQIL